MESPRLWVRSQPFDFATVQSPPSARLTFQAMRRLCTAVRSKSPAGQADWLSFTLWKSFAVSKLHYSEDLAWAFFETYDALSEAPVSDRLALCRQLAACTIERELDSLKNRTKVFLPKFLLLLLLQLSSQLSFRTLSTQDVALGARGPPLHAATAKVTEENLHKQFFLTQLPQLLSLLSESDGFVSSAAGTANQVIPFAAMEALGLLVAGTIDGRIVRSVDIIAQLQTQVAESGYSKITRSFNVAKLHAWIQKLLGQNPFGVDVCIAKRRQPASSSEAPAGRHVRPLTIGKTASNYSYAPSGNGLVLFSQVNGQTVVRSAEDLGNSGGVVIKRSHNCTFYLLAPMRFVRIERCRNMTIVLGAVRDFVKLSHCQDLQVYTVARRLHVSDCTNCTLHACTPTHPLLLFGVCDLTLAPYNTHYPYLERHMRVCGLAAEPNYWDQPVGTSVTGQAPSSCFKLMEPRDFLPFCVPFEMSGGTTKAFPGSLPQRYMDALEVHKQRVLETRHAIEASHSGESKARKRLFLQSARETFKDWCRDRGYQREVNDLAELERVTSVPAPRAPPTATSSS